MPNLQSRTPLLTRPSRVLPLAVAALLASGCAATHPPTSAPSAADIPTLEARLAREPNSVPVMVRLGMAYRRADQLGRARAVLERATARQQDNSAAVLLLGLTYEDLQSYTEARRLYEQYVKVGRAPAVKEQLKSRIPLMRRKEFEVEVRSALLRERELEQTPPERRRVAVFPLLYSGDNPALQPLSRALAEMLATDLAQAPQLTVLERAHVQTLLDEIELGERGLVDQKTAARSGRLLSAGRIVQGQIEGGEDLLRLQAAVVDVESGANDGARVSDQAAVLQLFEMEKRLALGILRSLGVQLTPALQERISKRQTSNFQALLAYGLGLQAEDEGDFALAAQHFARAAALDPNFSQARERATRSTAMASATRVSTAQVAQAGVAEIMSPIATPASDLAAVQEIVRDPSQRNPAAEVFSKEAPGGKRPAIVEVILRRP